MLDVSIINTIITGAVTVAVAILGIINVREKRDRESEAAERAKREEEQREREEDRHKIDECIMGMTAANSDALLIVLKHLRGEALNGDVEQAIKAIESEVTEYSKVRDKVVANL